VCLFIIAANITKLYEADKFTFQTGNLPDFTVRFPDFPRISPEKIEFFPILSGHYSREFQSLPASLSPEEL
jgi:hypothetical protein